MSIYGYRVKDPNFRLRFLVIIFCGIIVYGAIAFWKTQLEGTTDYVELPKTTHIDKAAPKTEQKATQPAGKKNMLNKSIPDFKNME